MIELLPDYFFQIPASSTGKYHPEFSLGDGGLVRHVKAAVKIAKDLLDNPCIGSKYTNDEKDLMIMTLILHDGLKSGLKHNKYTQANHPTLIKNYIIENKEKLELTDKEVTFVGKAIESHMGPWNTDYTTEVTLDDLISEYEVTISPLIIGEIYVMGLGIVLISVIIPSFMIMRYNPKQILMNQN